MFCDGLLRVSQNKRSKENIHFPVNLKTPHSENRDVKVGVESPRVHEQPSDLQSPKSSSLTLSSSPHVVDKRWISHPSYSLSVSHFHFLWKYFSLFVWNFVLFVYLIFNLSSGKFLSGFAENVTKIQNNHWFISISSVIILCFPQLLPFMSLHRIVVWFDEHGCCYINIQQFHKSLLLVVFGTFAHFVEI